jgi:hypothetical protein
MVGIMFSNLKRTKMGLQAPFTKWEKRARRHVYPEFCIMQISMKLEVSSTFRTNESLE